MNLTPEELGLLSRYMEEDAYDLLTKYDVHELKQIEALGKKARAQLDKLIDEAIVAALAKTS